MKKTTVRKLIESRGLDARYSLQRYYCGYPTPKWVGLFCSERVTDSFDDKEDALMQLVTHNKNRF